MRTNIIQDDDKYVVWYDSWVILSSSLQDPSNKRCISKNKSDHTACNTAVVVDDESLRWLGPPSFPLTEFGRLESSVNAHDQKKEQEVLPKETSSSYIPNKELLNVITVQNNWLTSCTT